MEQEMELSEKTQKEIQEQIKALKAANPKLKRVFSFYVIGSEEDDKEIYIGYFKRPSITSFSKYMALAPKDSVNATRELAKECFLGGDKELISEESLFLYGLMPYFSQIIEVRKGGLANFSPSGK